MKDKFKKMMRKLLSDYEHGREDPPLLYVTCDARLHPQGAVIGGIAQ